MWRECCSTRHCASPAEGIRSSRKPLPGLAAATRRRTYRFGAQEDLAGILPFIPNFQNVAPGVFDLFARTTLRESGSGEGYELRCPPE